MTYLALSFLGRFEVAFDAEPITAFGSDKARALLAYLAIESARPHRRAKLSGMFWPDLPEQKAAHNLSQSLLRLRQALGGKKDVTIPLVLIITPQQIQFNTSCNHQLDVAHFRQLLNLSHQHIHPEAASCGTCMKWLEQAVELYHGDLLAGLFVSDSTAFEEWRMIQQEELRQQMLEALSRLTVYHEQRGNFELAQKYARRQIALEPWHEAARFQLMRALVQIGQTSAAQKEYESYRKTLAEESGIKPSAAITAFYEQIKSGELAQPSGAQPGGGEIAWISDHGERRQVTALACSHGTEADPEELHTKLSVCERHCEAIFNRFGGRRIVRQGETCLVYFGYPQSYEDAARRAVHSGLAIADALKEHGGVRIGIHTGLMAVGEKRGRRWQDRDLIGKAPETARDCLRLAHPGEVLVTEETRRLVQDSFDFQIVEMPIFETKGQPGAVYRVRGEGSSQNRLDWLAQTQRLTVLTGRVSELALLKASYEKVLHGQGQVVLLRGEPGIGKSRLLWELEKSAPMIDAQNNVQRVLWFWFASRCLPHDQNISLSPVIGLLEGLLGFQTGDSPDVHLEKLTGMLAWYHLNQPSAVWLLSTLLGLPTDTAPAETITQAQREQMCQVFIALVQQRAAEQPLVLVIEDLHWSDPSTLEWLRLSLPSLASVPCLMLLTARPGFDPASLSQPDARSNMLLLPLNPLPPEQVEQMMFDLAGRSMLAEDVHRRVVAQTDGIPLFVEELTKMLIEQSASKAGEKRTANIPATLLDSLAARLDHIGIAKETAQWAAVIGREFSYPVLQACIPYDDERLQSDLAHLIEAELISAINPGVHDSTLARSKTKPRYTFKHTLVQDAAYASMLQSTRQAYHRRIAETLETRFPHLAEARPEHLAQHYFEAGMPTQAIDLWLRAGERAKSQGATLEARNLLDRAIALIEPADDERLWQVLWQREKVLDFMGDREAQEADLTALMDLADVFNDDMRRTQVYLRQIAFVGMQGDYRAALPLTEAACAAARRAGSLTLELNALAYKAQALIFLEVTTARQIVEEMLAQLPKVEDMSVRAQILTVAAYYYLESGDLVRSVQLQVQSADAAQRAGNHKDTTIRANLGSIYATLGLYSQARSTLETALTQAELLADRWLHANILCRLGYVDWRSGEKKLAQQAQEKALNELTIIGDAYGEAACLAYLGYILEDAGEWASAEEYLTKARAGFAEIGVDSDRVEAQAVEARVVFAQGRQEEARQLAMGAWNYLREHGTEELNSPSLLYVCIADVLDGVEISDVSAHEVIEAGYRDLMQKAEKISDPEWRCSFLENIDENRAIVEQWEKRTKQIS
jgi:predicted ATPase/DNA-binding SARP family transcriptional activator/class 3 adenylate cyclase